jgi:hypothetical protein
VEDNKETENNYSEMEKNVKGERNTTRYYGQKGDSRR